MFKTIVTSKKYWISVCLLGAAFVFLYSIIEHFGEFSRMEFDAFVEEKFSEGRWIRYAISRVVGGFFYGTIMAYFFEKRKQKLR